MALPRTALLLAGLLAVVVPATAASQQGPPPPTGSDSITVVAGDIYKAGGFHRALLGDNYRYEWTTPIRVPVLNLRTFHGGLKPTKEGGGQQTKSLRFDAGDGSEYVFRSVRKEFTILPDQYKGTIIWSIVKDEGSASHPLAAIPAAPMLAEARVLHVTPRVYMMPDDPVLGEFRKVYAGMLGTVEEYPDTHKNGPDFAGADKIINSDELLDDINKDPKDQVDARAFLTARLMDLFLGDNDRHPDQWKWAKFGKREDTYWQPIPRDRDKVFVSYEGLLLSIMRKPVPSLVKFGSEYADPSSLFENAREFDRRLLQTLDRTAWDSVSRSLRARLTDPVIDNAIRTLPPEWAADSRDIAAKLKARRNGLPAAADKYYHELWEVADIHGTDANDVASIVRSGNGLVDITIRSGNNAPYFSRRFDARDTKEIRVYLHGGDDTAAVTGTVGKSIEVRVIGGNGTNTFADLSTVGGRTRRTHFYDAGTVRNVKYAKDTLDEKSNANNAFNHLFNRRPWVHAYGGLEPPQLDRGASMRPVVSVHSQRSLGIYPVVGVARTVYGFRKVPYSTFSQLDFARATASSRFRVRGFFDKRFEESDTHIPITARMSQFEVVQFHGFGNDVPDLRGRLYDVKQTQWLFNPGVGHSFNPVSDISLGPIVRYTTTDSLANRFIAQQRPTGFSKYGEAGMQLRAHLDSRYYPDTLRPRFVFDLIGDGYPGLWDVNQPYESVDGWAAAFFTLPVPKKPVLAFRGGGKKLWGDFPYFDAAFIGGSETLRTEERQRYAGDASIYGTTELRIPVAKFPFILPLDVGILGFADAARVYLNGQSPGGWHSAAGGGFWVGFLDPGKSVNVLFTNSPTHHITTNIGFAF